MNPLVSIIIPVYNAEDYLVETLESAIGQTWANKEIIIVDDGSTDQSLSIAKSYVNDSIKVFHQENKGASSARNYGLREAKGNYIQFLDADDLLSEDKIEKQLNILKNNPDCIIGCYWIRFNKKTNNKIGLLNPPLNIRRNLSALDWLLAKQTMLVHAWLTPINLIKKAGKWDETLSYNDDGEFFARVITNTKQVLFCMETIVYYRTENPNSMSALNSSTKLLSAYNAALSFEKALRKHPNNFKIEKVIGNNYKEILIASYPKFKEVYQMCLLQPTIRSADFKFNAGGKIAHIIALLFGWKAVKKLRIWLKQ